MSDNVSHQEIGYLTIVLITAAALVTGFALATALRDATGPDALILTGTAGLVVIFIGVLYLSFFRLTVRLSDDVLTFRLGVIGVRKALPIPDIESASVVTNPWYYFWGVKSIPGGTFYAVSPAKHGLELTLDDGRVIRLGLDESAARTLHASLNLPTRD